MPTELEKEILKVIVYFDMFDYPLTLLEIKQYLAIPSSYLQILQAIKNSEQICKSNGFYFLSNKKEIITTRQERYNLSFRKMKRALLVSKAFSFLPWIKMISVVNMIGAHNMRKDGDIDLFIITEPHKLWLTRLFCVGLLKLFRLRPTEKNFENTICLSFFTTDNNLDFQSLLLQQEVDYPDRYFTYWLANIYPIYNQQNTYQNLIKKNSWLQPALPNWQPIQTVRQRTIPSINSKLYYLIIGFVLNGFSGLAKKLQYTVMAKQLKDKMNQNTEVIINDQMLKLHTTDRRQNYYQKYITKLQEVMNNA